MLLMAAANFHFQQRLIRLLVEVTPLENPMAAGKWELVIAVHNVEISYEKYEIEADKDDFDKAVSGARDIHRRIIEETTVPTTIYSLAYKG